MTTATQRQKSSKNLVGSTKTHKEIVSFLDSQKEIEYGPQAPKRMKQLDALLGNISQKIDIVLVGGTNGKSSTIHFANKLLKEEGYKVGTSYSSHILNYNERIAIDFETIQNKAFTDSVNEVIGVVETNKIQATSFEITTMAALLYFVSEKSNVALLEVGLGGKHDATSIFNPKIVAITRIAQDRTDVLGDDLDEVTIHMLSLAKPGSRVISAEQSKIRLGKMKECIEKNKAKWEMSIRKLAALPYMYEQLYGRSASLGERIAQIYVEDIKQKFSPFLKGNLLATKRGQRGRPTLEAKRNAELHPIKTLKKFWQEEFSLLPSRFELLNKGKPSILLDNADNLDAFANTFLGVRLLHYQHSIKDLSLIMGLTSDIDMLEALKLVRYLLKKVNGQVIFVSIDGIPSHSPQDLVKTAKELGLKAKSFDTFEKAFEAGKASVDEREGLAVLIGHQQLIRQYWTSKGIKKV